MPKDISDRIIIFSVIGLVAWAIFGLPLIQWLFDPQGFPHYQPCTGPSCNYNHYRNEPWLTKDAAGFFTFLLVVVGGVQVGLFYWQLRYMRTGMEDASK